jgi:hypothetical protein
MPRLRRLYQMREELRRAPTQSRKTGSVLLPQLALTAPILHILIPPRPGTAEVPYSPTE